VVRNVTGPRDRLGPRREAESQTSGLDGEADATASTVEHTTHLETQLFGFEP
jgi:hypothetical protein